MIGMRIGPCDSVAVSSAVGTGADPIGNGGRTLIILAGQSNSLTWGISNQLTAPFAGYAATYPNVPTISRQSIANDAVTPLVYTDTTQDLGIIFFESANRIGYDATLFRDIDRERARGFAECRVVVGGTSSAEWDPASTSPIATPNLFSQLITRVQAARASFGCSAMIFVWDQGGSDSRDATLAAAYMTWLPAFVVAMRAQLGPIPFVFTRLNVDSDPILSPYIADVRAAQNAYAVSGAANVYMVDQDSLGTASGYFENPHYTADGYCQLGHLISPKVALAGNFRLHPTASYTTVIAQRQVTFTDTSVSYGNTVTAWLWNFGDASTSTSQSPVHTYSADGTYSVMLRVTNAAGDTDTSVAASVSVIGGIAGVTRDPTSAIYVPASASEWTAFLTAIGSSMSAPDGLWLCQESATPLVDTIGGLSLAVAGNPLYQQAITGWSRKAVTMTDNLGARFTSVAAGLPDVSTTSMFTLALVRMPSAFPAGVRNLLQQGVTGTFTGIEAATATSTRINAAGNTAIGTHNTLDGVVHPVAVQVDRTNNAEIGYTDADKMVPTFASGVSGKALSVGARYASGSGSANSGYLYIASWYGAKAEVTSAAIKALLQGMGFTVLW